MIAYQVTMTVILALGLVQQIKNLRLQLLYGTSKLVVALFLLGMFVSGVMISWTWLLR